MAWHHNSNERDSKKKVRKIHSIGFLGSAAKSVTGITSGIVICFLVTVYLVSSLDDYWVDKNYKINSNINTNTNTMHMKNNGNNGDINFRAGILPIEQTTKRSIVDNKTRTKQMLSDAGISMNDLDEETIERLPQWSQITALYGDGPRIYGLDQCDNFQNRTNLAHRFMAPAGAFNSGTNLLAELLIHNCHNPFDPLHYYFNKSSHIRWQVPWGKHNPPFPENYRTSHKAAVQEDVILDDLLSVVTIRDPYVWMASMCRHSYSARWRKNSSDASHCPNLTPHIPVRIQYAEGMHKKHESLAHFWNEWYGEYVKEEDQIVTFDRIIVRYEDLVFYAKETTELICQCYGGNMVGKNGKFHYITKSAKFGENGHGSTSQKTDYVEALIRYGTAKNRYEGMLQRDRVYAKESLRKDLMQLFRYTSPDDG